MRGTEGNLPTFSVVVPTFRRPEALQVTLEALLVLDYPSDRYEVIVVDDDAGSDETARIVRARSGHGVEVSLACQERLGAASARNRGARAAGGQVLVFLDDDMIVEADHLRRHSFAREVENDPLVSGAWQFTAAVLSELGATPFGRYRLELEQKFQDEAAGDATADGRLYEMAVLGAANLALRRDLFWELGGFDERFPVAGAEDQDFSLRARSAGCRLLLDSRNRCLHNDKHLTLRAYCAREERSAKTMPYLARNYPAQFAESPYVRENRPIERGDEVSLIVKKLAKLTLSRGPALEGLHWLTTTAEAVGAPDRALRRLYRLLLGLHLFRGFRSTWPG